MQPLDMLNNMKNIWWTSEIQTAAQNIQHVYDFWTPALQTISYQQHQVQMMASQLETIMLNRIHSSYADLARDVKVSALSSALGAFASLEFPDHDLSVDTAELTEEESAQLAAELSEAVEDHQNWQQRLMAILQSWKTRNPLVAGIVQLIVTTVISQLIWQSLCWGAATLKDSILREEPNSKAAVICQIKQGETVTVVGDTPYYYLVKFDDPDTDEHHSGYISKKSVRLTQSDSD